jgi:hypothetical protein
MSLQAITCNGCGGAIAMAAGASCPQCLFCGSDALVVQEAPEDLEQPDVYVAFSVDGSGAKEVFQTFAKSSWFHPGDLRQSQLNVRDVLVPAWVWSGDLETHYAALVHAATQSGKRPVTGRDDAHLSNTLVLAGSTLTRGELSALTPFSHEDTKPFMGEGTPHPFELSRLTRSVAREEAKRSMRDAHAQQIRQEINAIEVRASSLYENLEGRPLLLPVYIGAYRYKDTLYRLVINGQTGTFTGKGPKSPWRILFVVCVFFALIGGVAALVAG